MTGKSLRCVLKPHVLYKKIPKNCHKICNNIAHRRKTYRRNKTVSFNTEPPVNTNVSTQEPSVEQPIAELNSVEKPSDNSNEPTEETPPIVNANEPAKEEPSKQTGIINRITSSASNLFGLSAQPVSNNDNVKVGGKTAKKRKCNNKKTQKNKRNNKLKR